MRAIAHPASGELALTAVLHALSDPVRLEIVRELSDNGECPAGMLPAPVAKSTLSHHLRVLRDAGLTRTRADGVQRLVSLRDDDIERRFPGLLGCVLSHSSVRPLM